MSIQDLQRGVPSSPVLASHGLDDAQFQLDTHACSHGAPGMAATPADTHGAVAATPFALAAVQVRKLNPFSLPVCMRSVLLLPWCGGCRGMQRCAETCQNLWLQVGSLSARSGGSEEAATGAEHALAQRRTRDSDMRPSSQLGIKQRKRCSLM